MFHKVILSLKYYMKIIIYLLIHNGYRFYAEVTVARI